MQNVVFKVLVVREIKRGSGYVPKGANMLANAISAWDNSFPSRYFPFLFAVQTMSKSKGGELR